MTEKQRVLVLLSRGNQFNPYFTALQDHLTQKGSSFAFWCLNLPQNPSEKVHNIEHNLTRYKYSLVLTPLEESLYDVIRQRHSGNLVGYTYSRRFPEEEAYDGIVRFTTLRNASDGLVQRIEHFLRSTRL